MGLSVEQKNSNMLARYHERKRQALTLLGGACVQCGTTEDLEFDHIDPATKTFTITERIFRTWDQLLPELAKCQLLCETCHAAKTNEHYKLQAARRPPRAKQLALPVRVPSVAHGSAAMYNHYKCRCPACREAHRLKMQAYRAQKGMASA